MLPALALAAALNQGVLLRNEGRPEDAAAQFQRAAELDPKDADIWAELGEVELQAWRLDAAQKDFSQALALDPGHFYARLGLGQALLASGDAAGAAKRLEQAVKARPASALASYFLGRALERRGALEPAQRAYQEALHKDGQFSEIRLPLGAVMKRRKEVNEAWVQYAKVVELEPRNRAAGRAKSELDQSITKKPEELIPVVRIAQARQVEAAPGRAAAPSLRVAIGTTPSGKPVPLASVAVRSSGAFTVRMKSGGEPLARGKAGEVWGLRKAADKPGFELVGPDGQARAAFNAAVLLAPVDAKRDTIVLDAVPSARGYAWAALKDRELRETVEAVPQGGGLALFNDVHLEDYLYGVLAEEMPVAWPLEALKAQAVLARTHALNLRASRTHRKDGYDLCDGQHCQVYGGVTAEYPKAREAVDATHGQVLRRGAHLASALYSSSCGGHTQSAADAGWSPTPGLAGVPDTEPGVEFPRSPWAFELWIRGLPRAWCGNPKYTHPAEYRWSRVISADDLSARANRHAAIGRVRAVRVSERGASGHVHRVDLIGAQGTWSLTHEAAIRRLLGLGPLRSTFFIAEAYRGPDGRVQEFIFHGAGWGHGVGFCQSGAAGQADAGRGYRAILKHYYPETRIGDSKESS